MTLPDPLTEPTIDVQRAAEISGFSSWAIYEAIKRGDDFPGVVRCGRRIRIATAVFLNALGLPTPDDPKGELGTGTR